jgi:hypothetical protein
MKKLASHLPLQDMLRSVIENATEKLAEDESKKDKVNKLVAYEQREHGHIPTPEEEENEKVASASLSSSNIEKLASACEFIAANLDSIEFPIKGVLQKAAEEGSPAGAGKGPGHLEVSKAIGGEQAYKKDKAKGKLPSDSQAGSPLSSGGLPGGKTQLDNNMHDAPGGGDIKPTAKYPEKGPLVAGPTTKHAGIMGAAALGGGAIGAAGGAVAAPSGDRLKGAGKGALVGAGMGMGSAHLSKMSSVRQRLLAKLAGEDVLKASIDGGGTVSPLAGEGQLKTTTSDESSPGQSGDASGSDDGNSGRKYIASNDAARNYTKGDAKGPVKTQLKEVLEQPALTSSTDSKLEENLRNTGKAGVKIAAAKAALTKIAQEGCHCGNNNECSYCQLKGAVKGRESEKTANAMMGYGAGSSGGMGGGGMPPGGGGMAAMADAGAGADGCVCGGMGECRICKLKAALAAAKAQGGMLGAMPGAGVPGAVPTSPVEKDSNYGPSC